MKNNKNLLEGIKIRVKNNNIRNEKQNLTIDPTGIKG